MHITLHVQFQDAADGKVGSEPCLQYVVCLSGPGRGGGSSSDVVKDAKQDARQRLEEVVNLVDKLQHSHTWHYEDVQMDLFGGDGGRPLHLRGSSRCGGSLLDEWFVVW